MLRLAAHAVIVLILTVLTQIGGLAWIAARFLPYRIPAFAALYAAASLGAAWVAPAFGRVPLPCAGEGGLRMQSVLYCALNRHYVVPELRGALEDMAAAMEARFPGTPVLVLDAGFPFLDGFPLLPHLSHDDGRKADLAFWYENAQGYAPGVTRSPVGYFAFEDGPTDCPRAWPTLRWDMPWMQGIGSDHALEPERTAWALRWLAGDPRIGKVFVEPHLADRLGVASPKIRFQGCRAARHDDHIHLQL